MQILINYIGSPKMPYLMSPDSLNRALSFITFCSYITFSVSQYTDKRKVLDQIVIQFTGTISNEYFILTRI